MLQNFFKIDFVLKSLETPVNEFIVTSIFFKNLFQLLISLWRSSTLQEIE